MATPIWSPGTLYQPGDIVRPRSGASITQDGPSNPSFESSGLDGWTQTTDGGAATWSAVTTKAFDGTHAAYFIGGAGTFQGSDGQMGILKNDNVVSVVPGQTINASGRATFVGQSGAFAAAGVRIYWYASDDTPLGYAIGPTINPGKAPRKGPPGTTSGWLTGDFVEITCSGVAPADAAKAQFAFVATGNGNGSGVWCDLAAWDYSFADTGATPEGLVFRAIQAAAGFSGAEEPAWPTSALDTVVDNDVTWEATTASRIVWTGAPILVSGVSEPTFPTDPSSTVADNTISWRAMPWTIDDEHVPHSKIVAIISSKVFAGDDDIAPFSATVNPLDWSTDDDAGYLPFGLQTYGAQPIKAFGLYRGNLLIFNAQGFQLWQVGEDPADHALLDAVPVGSTYHRAGTPIANDFAFLTDQGIRSIGIAAASTNLQADDFGKAIDPLVIPKVKSMAGSHIPGVPEDPNLTVGQSDSNFGLLQSAGALSPAITIDDVPLTYAYYDISGPSFAIQFGNGVDSDILAQDAFTTVYVQTADGLVSYAASEADVYLTDTGLAFWGWNIGGSDPMWTSADIGEEYRITFDEPIVLPVDIPGTDPLGLFIPALGQYWLICDDEAFVLTSNGSGKDAKSWSRYTFPSDISDWTILDGDLYLRSGDIVWRVDEDAVYDDQVGDTGEEGTTGEGIEGYVAWPYLDLGQPGQTKQLDAFDLVIEGEVDVQFGYDQSNDTRVTPAYTLTGDTLPGEPIAMPLSAPSLQLRLTFAPGQQWSWNMAVLYVSDFNTSFAP